MPNLSQPTQELHVFPVAPELEGVDFVDLSRRAQDRFAGKVAVTPLERSETLSYGDNSVFIKRADQLPGGCFKFLSASTAVAELTDEGHEEFAFATAGSYGIAAGHAINTYGGQGTGFVPIGTNKEKQQAMRDLGIDVIEYDGNFDETNEYARQYAEERGIKYLHPYASLANIAGTGILGLELDDQCPGMTYLVSQFGGGSLSGGLGSVIKQLRPDVRFDVVQVAGCSPFVDSVLSGTVQEAVDISTITSKSYFSKLGGVGVGKTDPMTLGISSRIVDSVDTVRIDRVYATMHDVQEDHGVLPEFAAAVSLERARKLARSHDVAGATIVAVLTGACPDEYPVGYLEGMSGRRQQDEYYGRSR
jgi:threonine dehydratase